jgi:6-pyruvoyltetrahydropterin/6-carboxytetrahydropterin synthase
MRKVYLTKRLEFSASHRYHNAAWDQARNERVFGACNRAPGHGHNYLLEVTVGGSVAQDTGMVVNLFDLKVLLLDMLTEFDHKHLNMDTPYFSHRNPTTENIATVFWSVLSGQRELGSLQRIRLYEDEDLYAEVTPSLIAGGEARVVRRHHFSAGHRVDRRDRSGEEQGSVSGAGDTTSLHGHDYAVEVAVTGPIDPDTGMVTDLEVLDRSVRDTIVARFGGRTINEDPAFDGTVATGEHLSQVVWALLTNQIAGGRLEWVRIVESPDAAFDFIGGSVG